MTSKGLKWICPVGYDKLVPSVPAASRALGGASHIDISLGADPGMNCLSSADIVTEAEAIKMMFHCEAKVVCASGIGGNEGAPLLGGGRRGGRHQGHGGLSGAEHQG